jgi:hypothetical protein
MTPLIVVVGREGGGSKDEMLGASVAQSSQQAPFTSENVSSIPAMDSCEKSRSTLCRKSCVVSGRSGFLPQGKLSGWFRINIVRKVISQLL